ncbi:MAG: MBL fold metallo-hydrolase, partial [Hungatella sp.]
MKVTYVEHSSFLVEMKRHYLLFDYFQGEIPKMDPKKELLVFASHRHGDHFSPVIFELAKEYPRIHYVISDDIWENRVPMELHGKVTFMGAGEEETIGAVEVKTYRSTDEGVAFLLSIEGKTIYHAGDLN